MKITRVTPTQFMREVLRSAGETTLVSPVMYNLTEKQYVIVDAAARQRFVKGDKIDLSFLTTLDLDLRYLRGSVVEDVSLEEIEDTVFADDSVLVLDQSDTIADDSLISAFNSVMSVLGIPMVSESDVVLSRIDERLHVEFVDCPYFQGTFSVLC